MSKPICVVAGVGPGNGLAICNRFLAAGYRVVILARDIERLTDYAGANQDIYPLACDFSDPESIHSAFEHIHRELGTLKVLVYNVGSGVFGASLDVSLDEFEMAWRVNALGLQATAQRVVPRMVKNGGGSILVTGATASLRGGANFAAFASAKAAQRSLCQSLARSHGKEGIHVALVVVDGVVDMPRTRERSPDKPDSEFLKPAAIAETFYQLSEQDESAWTFEIDLRPSTESW